MVGRDGARHLQLAHLQRMSLVASKARRRREQARKSRNGDGHGTK